MPWQNDYADSLYKVRVNTPSGEVECVAASYNGIPFFIEETAGQQVMTPSLGKAELIKCYEDWEKAGLVYDSKGFAENLVVELDPNDPYAMNFFIPVHLVKQFFVSKSKILHD